MPVTRVIGRYSLQQTLVRAVERYAPGERAPASPCALLGPAPAAPGWRWSSACAPGPGPEPGPRHSACAVLTAACAAIARRRHHGQRARGVAQRGPGGRRERHAGGRAQLQRRPAHRCAARLPAAGCCCCARALGVRKPRPRLWPGADQRRLPLPACARRRRRHLVQDPQVHRGRDQGQLLGLHLLHGCAPRLPSPRCTALPASLGGRLAAPPVAAAAPAASPRRLTPLPARAPQASRTTAPPTSTSSATACSWATASTLLAATWAAARCSGAQLRCSGSWRLPAPCPARGSGPALAARLTARCATCCARGTRHSASISTAHSTSTTTTTRPTRPPAPAGTPSTRSRRAARTRRARARRGCCACLATGATTSPTCSRPRQRCAAAGRWRCWGVRCGVRWGLKAQAGA
jgi:hypothetical protein